MEQDMAAQADPEPLDKAAIWAKATQDPDVLRHVRLRLSAARRLLGLVDEPFDPDTEGTMTANLVVEFKPPRLAPNAVAVPPVEDIQDERKPHRWRTGTAVVAAVGALATWFVRHVAHRD